MKRLAAVMVFLCYGVASARSVDAAVTGETVAYQHAGTELEGYLAYNPEQAGTRPGVMIIHAWNGLGDFERSRARALAELGYAAFALDMYGKGVRPQDRQSASAQAGIYRRDRALMRARARAGLDRLLQDPRVDPKRVAVMGYCFGGGAALELARSGAPVAGTVSFHGNLDTPHPGDANSIQGQVLVLHGADDPNVPPPQVTAFQEEMRNAGVDWQMVCYGNAVHSFTNPAAGDNPAAGSAYNAKADRRSWTAMRQFYEELFGAAGGR